MFDWDRIAAATETVYQRSLERDGVGSGRR
jgi:hypothetical protein